MSDDDPRRSNTCANCGTPIYRQHSTRWPWRHRGSGSTLCAGSGSAPKGPTAKPVTT